MKPECETSASKLKNSKDSSPHLHSDDNNEEDQDDCSHQATQDAYKVVSLLSP